MSSGGVDAPLRVAIQGELGSNSHMAALALLQTLKKGLDQSCELVPCSQSAQVFERLQSASADLAVLPIENSLHGSVFEHYDLLLEHRVHVTAETLLRIHHNVITVPGVELAELRTILSHPVALSQCRRWLRAHPRIEVVPFYDTAGSVKSIMERGARETAGIAPRLAAEQYGAEILVEGIEDHSENYTRFYMLTRDPLPRAAAELVSSQPVDKMSLAFTVAHRPGTLIGVLEVFRDCGLNLTKIESRPVHGRPWEYIFFVDVRFTDPAQADSAVAALRAQCDMVRELGRYRAA